MAGLLLELDPERAYKHAQVAVARAGRVDVVREAGAVAAYATGRYGEALREFRTVRRLNGSNEHVALMADCERGLGRPERAIALGRESESADLDARQRAELDIVLAGARMDLGENEAAYVALGRITAPDLEIQQQVDTARATVLRALGRIADAEAIEATLPAPAEVEDPWADDVTLYDVQELPDPAEYEAREAARQAAFAEANAVEEPNVPDVPEASEDAQLDGADDSDLAPDAGAPSDYEPTTNEDSQEK